MKVTLIILTVLIILVFLGWLGLQIKPAPFPPYSEAAPSLEMIPLPDGLPVPVELFYRERYGENIPVINTAVISGRGTLELFRLKFPIRFRFTHEAGKNFRSDIDITFFSQPVMQALEVYVDGHGHGRTPGGVNENEEWFDQSANIRMWAEVIDFFPAVLLTNPKVHWKSIDDHTALLIVPFGNTQDDLIVRFDPIDHQAQFIEAMKYKNADQKVLWINGIWMDEGRPWLSMKIEEIVYNVDVKDYIRSSTH